MTVLAAVLASFIAVEGLLVLAFPEFVKKVLAEAPSRLLQLAGALELLLATAALAFIAFQSGVGG